MSVVNTSAGASELYETASPVVLNAMREGCAMRTAASLAGVSAALVCKWVAEGERDPEGPRGQFARAVRMIQGEHIAKAERAHERVREEGNAGAIQWYLARMDRETYGDEPTVVVDQRAPLPEATPEQVRAAIKGGGK